MSFNMRNPRVCSRLNICDSFPGRPFRWLMYLWCVWLFSTSGQSPGNLLGGSYASWEGAVLLHLLMTCFLLGNKRFSAAIAVDLLWVHVRDNLRMLVLCSHSKRGVLMSMPYFFVKCLVFVLSENSRSLMSVWTATKCIWHWNTKTSHYLSCLSNDLWAQHGWWPWETILDAG